MDWILSVLLLAIAAPVTAWMAGAIYYDVCGGARWGRWVAAGWVGRRRCGCSPSGSPSGNRSPFCSESLALFLVWWLRLKPSHHREWDASVALMPRAVREGDAVTIENVRNFEYRSLDDFTPRYETRTYHLANLKGVDIIFFNWGIAADEPPRARLRLRAGRLRLHVDRGAVPEGATVLDHPQPVPAAGVDLPRRRRARRHPPPHEARAAAGGAPVPLQRDARGSCGPPSSTTLRRSTACTKRPAGITACPRTAPPRSTGMPNSRCRLDWRVLANGRLDRALYEDGRLDRTLPFPELRRIAYLNDLANSAPEAGFGDHIRRELEMRRHER